MSTLAVSRFQPSDDDEDAEWVIDGTLEGAETIDLDDDEVDSCCLQILAFTVNLTGL